MKKIVDDLKIRKVMVSDGAWGTFLQKKGLQNGECPEMWNLTHRNDILDIARSYILSGSDMIESNSFGANSIKLAAYGLSLKASEINEHAANISREAAGNEKHVISSIGPTGKMLIMGDIIEEEMYNAFKEQAIALEKGGADAVCIETMSALDEALIAVKAVKENTKLEILVTFTFEKRNDNFFTMMGVAPSDMIDPLIGAGADIIGTNCGNGIENMIDIVKEIRNFNKQIPVIVQANAGLPQYKNGEIFYNETPDIMASYIPALIEAGTNIIGGCCGTTQDHISAIRKAVNKYIAE